MHKGVIINFCREKEKFAHMKEQHPMEKNSQRTKLFSKFKNIEEIKTQYRARKYCGNLSVSKINEKQAIIKSKSR